MNRFKKDDMVNYYGAIGLIKHCDNGAEIYYGVKFENDENIHMIKESNLTKIN